MKLWVILYQAKFDKTWACDSIDQSQEIAQAKLVYERLKHPDWPTGDATGAWEHYEKVGWKVGKNPVAKWRMCVSTCHRHWVERGGVPERTDPPALSGEAGFKPFTPLPPMIPFDKLLP